MKKTYSNPTIDVVKFEARRGLLFGSDKGTNQINGGGNMGNYGGSGQLGHEDNNDW